MKPTPVPISFNRGVNLLDDPAAIRDDEVCLAKNLWMKKPGVVAKRPGMNFAQSFFQQASGTQEVVRDFEWLPASAVNKLVAVVREAGVDKLKLFPSVYYSPSYTGTPKEQSIGASKLVPCIVGYGNRVYVFNGQSNGWYLDPTDVDAQGQFNFRQVAWNDVAAANVNPALATVVRERFWYANLGTGYEDYVVVSDYFEPTTIANTGTDPLLALGRAFRVGKAGEGPITAIAELSATAAGTEASTMVAVWKNNKMFLITGEPLETDGVGDPLGDLDIIKVNTDAGCVSQRSVCSTPYGLIWAGFDDVWMMAHGGQPQRVGTKIRPALLATPPGLHHLWHAAYHDGHYRLALFSDGLGPSDLDSCDEQWWLDLRAVPQQGIPNAADARWMGPQCYVQSSSSYKGTSNMRVSGKELYSLTSYVISTEHPTYPYIAGLSLVTFDGGARDVCAPSMAFRDWQDLEAYASGDIITPRLVDADVYSLQTFVASGGTSGASRPAFNFFTDVIGDGSTNWDGNWGSASNPPAVLEPFSRQTDNEVLVSIISKEVMGDGMVDKLFCGIELGYYASQSMKLKYTAIIDYELDQRTITLDSAYELDMMTLDTTSNPNRKWETRFLPPDTGKRSVGKSGQVRIDEQAGILITENNSTMTLSIDGVVYTASLTVGTLYDTVWDYLEAWRAAWFALMGHDVFVFSLGSSVRFGPAYYGTVDVVVTAIAGVTQAMLNSNYRFLYTVGLPWSTGVDRHLYKAGVAEYGDPTYYQRQVATLELSGINVKYRQFKRRPT